MIGRDYSKLKKCSKCGREKDLSCYDQKKDGKDGLKAYCKVCRRSAELQSKYGITIEDFDEMLRNNDYKCSCCNTIWPGGKYNRFNCDHDHDTGKIRGLLCHNCNLAVGGLGDDVPGLVRAVEYLRRHYG